MDLKKKLFIFENFFSIIVDFFCKRLHSSFSYPMLSCHLIRYCYNENMQKRQLSYFLCLLLLFGCAAPSEKKELPEKEKEVQEINPKHYTLQDIQSAFENTEGFKDFTWNEEAALKESGPIVFDETYSSDPWHLQICIFDSSNDARYYFENELANFEDKDKSVLSSNKNQVLQVDSDYSQFYIYKIQDQCIAGMQGSYVNEYNDETDKAQKALDEFLNHINEP